MVREEIVDGFQNAPHRSLYHALGLTAEEQRRPLIGIVSSYNEIVPGHMNLDKITEAVKLGVAMAGGTLLFVDINEILPETYGIKQTEKSAFAVFLGFIFMTYISMVME